MLEQRLWVVPYRIVRSARVMAPAPQGRSSRKPADSDFYQQRLKAWQPILTPRWVVVAFLLVGIPFVAIGFGLKYASDSVVEHRVQYDGSGADPTTSSCGNYTTNNGRPVAGCTITIQVTSTMASPVYVYYELTNFYQNHRRYVKSVSANQLAGELDAGQLADSQNTYLQNCDPLRTVTENGTTRVLDPCGLIANSFFNDTFVMTSEGATTGITMREDEISWAADRSRFVAASESIKLQDYGLVKFINEMYPGIQDITNEHFIVWMRPAALPHFRKLYGRIETTITAGTNLTFTVVSNYPVSGFSGTKALVVSTVSVIGGKNPFLGIAYIVVGFAAIGLAALFALRSYFGGRRLGDTNYLKWAGTRR